MLILWIIILVPVLFFLTVFISICCGWFGELPKLDDLDNPFPKVASEVYSADGKVLGSYYIENRNTSKYCEFPSFLVDALIAREDHRFYMHCGVDPKGLSRVLVKTVLFNNKAEGGGSTITQQLARSLFPRDTVEFKASKFNMMVQKFKEWIIAVQLERKYTKEEIITLYLNSVAFTNDVYGIKAAAKVFFNKPLNKLNIEEAALLIGILKGITMYNPNRNPNRAFNRRNSVLRKMYEHKYLTLAQYDSLKVIPLKLNYKPQTYKTGLATYAREYIRYIMNREMPERDKYKSEIAYRNDSAQWAENPLYGWCKKNLKADGSEYNLYKDGLKIYTTIDSRMQQYAEDALTEHLSKNLQPGFFKAKQNRPKAPFANNMSTTFIHERIRVAMHQSERYRNMKISGYSESEIERIFKQKTEMEVFTWNGFRDTTLSPWDSIRYSKFFLRASFLAVDPANGHIKAYVGGPDIRYFKYDGVMMQKRQVGSTIKPFIYSIAINNGMSPCDKILNSPVTFRLPGGKLYTPRNDEQTEFDNEFVPLKWGLAHSVNNVVAGLLQQQQCEPLISLLHDLGVKSDIPEVPSICLGTPELTMNELVGGYTVFPGKGTSSQPMLVTRIEDKDGKIITEFTEKRREIFNAQTAYKMTQMLKEVVTSGTGQRIINVYGLKNDIGGKTGTTQNHSDGWFVGVTPSLVAAAWVGGDEPSIHFDYMNQGQGAVMALPIYATFLKKVYDDASIEIHRGSFEKPVDFEFSMDCKEEKQEEESL
jgi:penicillin-binding protein 1A